MTEDKFTASAIGDPEETMDQTETGRIGDDARPYQGVSEAVRARGSAVLSGSPNLALFAGSGDAPVALGGTVQGTEAMRTVATEALHGSLCASAAGEVAVDEGVPELVGTALEGSRDGSREGPREDSRESSRESPPAEPAPAIAMAVPVADRRDGTPDGPAVALVAEWEAGTVVDDGTVARMELLADYAAAEVATSAAADSVQRYRRDVDRYEEMVEVYDTILRHDLGNELQVITGFSDALQPRIEDEEVLDYVQRIHRTARNAADLVAAASETVATLEKSSEPVATDLEPVLSRAVRTSESTYDSLETTYSAAEFEQEVLADDLLQDVFCNILANAAIHTADEVSVDIYREDGADGDVVVGFADDGEGVAPAVCDRLFEMGKQGPESDRPGFGLGLARAIVQSYGGSISVEEGTAAGADFRVRLPRTVE